MFNIYQDFRKGSTRVFVCLFLNLAHLFGGIEIYCFPNDIQFRIIKSQATLETISPYRTISEFHSLAAAPVEVIWFNQAHTNTDTPWKMQIPLA